MPGGGHEDPARRPDVPTPARRRLPADPLLRCHLARRQARPDRADDAKTSGPGGARPAGDRVCRSRDLVSGPVAARATAPRGPRLVDGFAVGTVEWHVYSKTMGRGGGARSARRGRRRPPRGLDEWSWRRRPRLALRAPPPRPNG